MYLSKFRSPLVGNHTRIEKECSKISHHIASQKVGSLKYGAAAGVVVVVHAFNPSSQDAEAGSSL